MKKFAIAAAAAALMTGCATQTTLVNGGGQAVPAYQKSQTFFISGIGQEQTVNAAQVCGGAHNVAKVQSAWEPKDIAFSVVTLGIYTPRTAKVYCK